MTETPADPLPVPGKPVPQRDERLKAALKANMARRKAQARARAATDGNDKNTDSDNGHEGAD